MKFIKFPEAKYDSPEGSPMAIVKSKTGQQESLNTIRKILFSKEEARYINKHRHIYLVQDVNSSTPNFHFLSPFDQHYDPVDPGTHILKTLVYEGHKFKVLLERKWKHPKIKAHHIMVVMNGVWIKYGNFPSKQISKGKGWIKAILDSMVKEFKDVNAS